MIVYAVLSEGAPLCICGSLEQAMLQAQEFYTSMRAVGAHDDGTPAYVYDDCQWQPRVLKDYVVQDATTTEWILRAANGSPHEEQVAIRGYEVEV